MAVLHIQRPTGSCTIELPEGLVTIGRQGDNEVVLDDDQASRRHCTLHPFSGGYLLQDLGSRNGTQVGGQRVDRVVLRFGEAFSIGQIVLRVFEESAPVVEMIEAGDTTVDTEGDAQPARIVEEEAPRVEEGDASPDRILAEARRDLNSLRTAGADTGFALSDVTLLDCRGKPVHAGPESEHASEAVRTLRLLFYGAFRTRATDMHFEPADRKCHVRFRVDGKMLPVVALPDPLTRSLLNVVKVLAELNIAGRKDVQEGSFTVHVKRQVDCRVSVMPTSLGEKLVIRVLDTVNIPSSLDELGLSAAMLQQVRGVCHLDTGMMIVSGPTGSGKTTSLYTAIRFIDYRSRNVITIEDPIEYHLPGITQIQTDAKKGLTFSHILKSVLRQDPDVILVGEIRDGETAKTAMQAAMTGHLVFTTLHARDTIGSLFRLLDLGVEAYMVANSVSVCLAQRLVRVLCPHCKRSYRPKPSQLLQMKMENQKIDRLYTHVGCQRCMGVGFLGRQAIFELLNFNDDLRDALMTTKTIHDIRKATGDWTHQTLLESGYRKVAAGLTTIEEVERVAARE